MRRTEAAGSMRSTDVRVCVKCKLELPLEAFEEDDRFESGYNVKCKMCARRDRWKYMAHLKKRYIEKLEGLMICLS